MEAALDTRTSRGLTGDLDAHMQYSAAEALRQGGEASGAMGAGLGAGMGMAMASHAEPMGAKCPAIGADDTPASAPRRTRLAHRRQGPDDGAVFKGGHGANGG